MKHILVISHSRGIHGAETVMVSAIKALAAAGNRVTVVVPSIIKDEGLEGLLKHIQGVTIIALPYRSAGGNRIRTEIVKIYNMRAVWRLQRLIKEEKIDTIYSNTSITILGSQLAQRHKIRHIWHWHESPQVWFERIQPAKELYKHYIPYADAIVFISCTQQQDWEKALGEHIPAAHIIYNPIKRIPVYAADSHRAIRIGFIGHFEPLKNLVTLVKVFERLHEKRPDTELWLCGAQGQADVNYVKQLTDLHEPVLNILPQTQDVSAFYHQIDILVLPSWRETMPLVVLEAMQAGVCVLQTNRSGMNELIEDGKESLFFAPDDAETLYQLLTQCMNPDYRRTIAQAGQEKAIQLIKNSSFDAQITQLLCE